MDVHDKKTRSYNMSQIKGKNTKPEELVRKYLFSQGFRYRKNDKRLPGSPDIVLPKYKTVIFINGCFWHGHVGCKYFVWPKSNEEFWKNKIETNIARDKKKIKNLEELGWNVLTVWECKLKNKNEKDTLQSIKKHIMANKGDNNG
jgi:DNA mismatch endonuclease (patch repair protein)